MHLVLPIRFKRAMVVALTAGAVVASQSGPYAFDLSRHIVPPEEIIGGGPPKDGIPAILNPKFVRSQEADFLADNDQVVGLAKGGEAKAYPLRIMNWHEIVDDRVGGVPLAVTYCPLTASPVVFDRRIEGREVVFGVSGLLYQSNLLMYDRRTESLWSQLGSQAVAGSMARTELSSVPSELTTWRHWRALHPDTLVLSLDTGVSRDYTRDPYEDYQASESVMCPVSHRDARLPSKEPVLGIARERDSVAIVLSAVSTSPLEVEVGGTRLVVNYDSASNTTEVVVGRNAIRAVRTYWFAWAAFHPETRIWGKVSEAELKRRRSNQALEHMFHRGF
jgi:hypothetical protein